MAVASYTEDLADFNDADSVTDWDEFTGNSYNAQGSFAADNAYPFIQGAAAITQICTKDASVGSIGYDNAGGTGGHGTDGAYFVWQLYATNSNVGTYAQGGLRIVVGSSLADFDAWYVGGLDKSPYPYGGWTCNVANTTITADNTAGSPSGTEQFIGGAVYVVTGSNKGSPHGVDMIRYGRGSAIFEDGDLANGYATIAGFAAQNDNTTFRWGLIQEIGGGYLWQGRMLLGTSGTPVDFRDSNKTIFIKWTPKVTENFNLIEVQDANSYVSMVGFTFQVLDTSTASPGKFLMTDAATVYIDQCTFIDMDSFIFNKSTNPVEITDTTFRRCGLVTQGGAVFDGCIFASPSGLVAFYVDDLDIVDDCVFNSDGTGYAMELDPSMAGNSYTMSGCSFVGYAATDGSTGNECIYNDTTGTVTISVGTGQIPTVHDEPGSTTVITASVPLYIIVKDTNGDPIQNVQTGVYKTSDRTQIVNQDTDINGEVDTSYSQSTPVQVEVRCRKSSSGATRYKNYSSLQTIATTTGLSLSVTMLLDPNNNATI